MSYENFLQAIISLQKYFGKTLDDSMMDLYWKSLKNISDIDFYNAVKNIIDNFKPTSQVPFPLIAHFKESIGLSGKNRAQLAIVAIKNGANAYKSVSFGDYALHNTINRFGGWPIVARWTCEDWKFNEKNFIAAYEAMQCCSYGPEYLPGIFEIENSNKILSGRHKEIADKNSEVILISWKGFDNLQIENKKEESKLLESFTKSCGFQKRKR
jgi:hypothetical protein